jgi:hypothetical protein
MMLIIDGFEIDVEVTSEPEYDSIITTHPIEAGSAVADHIRNEPVRITIEGLVSNHPIGGIADRRGERDANGMLLFPPVDDAIAWILAIRARRQPVSITTRRRVYENMGLQSFRPPDGAEYGDALKFTATFVQLSVVTNERTVVPVARKSGAAKKVDRGNKPTETVEVPKQVEDNEPRKSWLTNMAEFATRAR